MSGGKLQSLDGTQKFSPTPRVVATQETLHQTLEAKVARRVSSACSSLLRQRPRHAAARILAVEVAALDRLVPENGKGPGLSPKRSRGPTPIHPVGGQGTGRALGS